MSNYHTGVLTKEVIEYLNVKQGEKYIDCTFGGGDYTGEILSKGGIVLALDRDTEAIDEGFKRFKVQLEEGSLTLINANFAKIDEIAIDSGFIKVAGIVYDFGVSSHQLDRKERGFSYLDLKAPLDMRMGGVETVKACDLLNVLSETELLRILRLAGVEKAKLIVAKIVDSRSKSEFKTVGDLVEILKKVYLVRGKANPYAKVFLALRIAVNSELAHIKESLPRAVSLLENGGRLVLVSFHSLEDKLAKELGKNQKLATLTKATVLPSTLETELNPKARSARMRAYEKIL